MAYESGRYKIIIGSPPNRKDISVEIYVDAIQWAEVYDDPGYPLVDFSQPPGGAPPIKAADALDLLNRAIKMLSDRPRKD